MEAGAVVGAGDEGGTVEGCTMIERTPSIWSRQVRLRKRLSEIERARRRELTGAALSHLRRNVEAEEHSGRKTEIRCLPFRGLIVLLLSSSTILCCDNSHVRKGIS
jgi:hypothetical protein